MTSNHWGMLGMLHLLSIVRHAVCMVCMLRMQLTTCVDVCCRQMRPRVKEEATQPSSDLEPVCPLLLHTPDTPGTHYTLPK